MQVSFHSATLANLFNSFIANIVDRALNETLFNVFTTEAQLEDTRSTLRHLNDICCVLRYMLL